MEEKNKNITIHHLNKVLCAKNIKLKEKSKQITELEGKNMAMQSELQQKTSDKSRCESRIRNLEDDLQRLKKSDGQRLADKDMRIVELEDTVQQNNKASRDQSYDFLQFRITN